MSTLKVLMVEDRADDAALLMERLRDASFDVQAQVVETEADYLSGLQLAPDIVLSDYRLPRFSGLRALELLKELELEVPFILVSGTLGEEAAVDAIRRGADDYLLKDRLTRLGTAVRQALERRRLKVASGERGRQLATLISNLPGLVYRCRNDANYTTDFVSAAVEQLTGYPAEDFRQGRRHFGELIHAEDRDRVWREIQAALNAGQPFVVNYRFLTAAGVEKWACDSGRGVRDAAGHLQALEGFVADITERRRTEQCLHDSETKYRELVEHAADGILVYDENRKFVFANPRSCELFGYSERELLGLDIAVTNYEADSDNVARRMHAAAAGQVLRYERLVRRKDGSAFPAEISLKRLDNGQYLAIFHDITQRRSREHRIARLTALHRVHSSINAAVVRIRDRLELLREICRIAVQQGGFSLGWISLLDAASGKLHKVAEAGLPIEFGDDPGFSDWAGGRTVAGFSERALRESRPAFDNDVVPEGDETIVRKVAIRAGQKSVITLPLLAADQPVGILSLYAPDRDHFDDEEIKFLTVLARDISLGLEFVARDEQVKLLAHYDSLTGLPNRSLFFDQLAGHLETARQQHGSPALLLLDLDRFRLVNDTLGRAAGDTLMAAVAARVMDAASDGDLVARVGADSFAILLSGDWKEQDAAREIEWRAKDIFLRPFIVGGEELRISATAGVAVFPADGCEPGVLFTNAEAALRDATARQVPSRFYSSELNARVAESLRLETRLRRALAADELVLWYQPKICARTGRITGLEALMRWQDPETGLVPPARFIPLMESTGLILDAGRWALFQVARDCRRWATSGIQVPRIAVNVSPRQLREGSFVGTVVDAAAQSQLAGSMLDLEITESAIMEDVGEIIGKLQAICGLGVEIAVDDFGTGHSSLSRIARLPIHALKIDRSFVSNMQDLNGDYAIVNSVISLAHSLNFQVVAEGVETREQAALLAKLGCDEMQGYLISRPLPRDAIPAFVNGWRGLDHLAA